jgi:hypothetical protein
VLPSCPKSRYAHVAGIHQRTGYPCPIRNYHHHHHSKLEVCVHPRDFRYDPNPHDSNATMQRALESQRLERVHCLQRNPWKVREPELAREPVRVLVAGAAAVAAVVVVLVLVLVLKRARKNACQSPHHHRRHRHLPLQSG